MGEKAYWKAFNVPTKRTRAGAPHRVEVVSVPVPALDAPTNQFWSALPTDVRERLRQHARKVWWEAGQTVFRTHEPLDWVYFPETAVISRLTRLDDGQTLETGLIGREGIADVAVLLGSFVPYDGVVQVQGTALKVDAGAVRREFRDAGPLQELISRYAFMLLSQSLRSAACNNFHSVLKRSARWLLTLHDVLGSDDFPITQDLLALMLGVRRPSVTLASRTLQDIGVIDYKHGRLTVCDRGRLEAVSCECYRVLRDERQALLSW